MAVVNNFNPSGGMKRSLNMGREVRRVKGNWQHPKDNNDCYVPLLDGAEFQRKVERWNEGTCKWGEGYKADYNTSEGIVWVPLTEEQKGETYESWYEEIHPDPNDYMPLWRDEERTHLMMYETTTEGTPISPSFTRPEELARWLADNETIPGTPVTTFDVWLSIINDPGNMFRYSFAAHRSPSLPTVIKK